MHRDGVCRWAQPHRLACQEAFGAATEGGVPAADGGILKLLFPHRYPKAVRRAQQTNPEKRPQSVAQLAKRICPRWGLWLLFLLLIGLFFGWMHPSGKMFPVTLDGGQTVYAKELSNWHRTVALVPPDTTAQPWKNRKQPSGDLVIPSHVRHRLLTYRVTDIDKRAFSTCDSIYHLSLPEGLQRIGFQAFGGCICLRDTVLYVPAPALEKYRNHPDWQVFGRIEGLKDE